MVVAEDKGWFASREKSVQHVQEEVKVDEGVLIDLDHEPGPWAVGHGPLHSKQDLQRQVVVGVSAR